MPVRWENGLRPDSPEFQEAENSVRARIEKLLKVNGTRSADSFHRELGLLLWDKCGMSRNEQGLREALRKIPELREEFWHDVRVPGDQEDYNQSLERAGRVADFLEFAELECALTLSSATNLPARIFARNIKRPMAKRSATTRAMQRCSHGNFKATVSLPKLHREELHFETVHLAQRSYK